MGHVSGDCCERGEEKKKEEKEKKKRKIESLLNDVCSITRRAITLYIYVCVSTLPCTRLAETNRFN